MKGPTAMKPTHDYEAEDDCRTLTRAEEIKMDKKRHSRARKHAAKQAKAHMRVAGKDVETIAVGHRRLG